MSKEAKRFGEFVKERRTELRLSQADLARLILNKQGEPSSFAYVSKIELGKQERIPVEKVPEWAKALQVSEETVRRAAGFQVDTYPVSDEAMEVARIFDTLPSPLRVFVRQQVTAIADLHWTTKPARERFRVVPVRGCVAAGCPIEWEDEMIGETEIPAEKAEGVGELFALRVIGDSMGEEIPDGSIAIFAVVRDQNIRKYAGQIVAVEVVADDGSRAGTVKRVRMSREYVVLEPLNGDHKPQNVRVDRVRVVGKFLTVGK